MILNNILVEQLSELGLSKKEAILYLALLELGPSSVQELAKTTKLNRSGIYSCLESLIKEDFSYMQEKDDTRIYTAKSPEVLMKKAELLAKTFSKTSRESLSLLTDLNGLAPRFKPEPRVLFSEGRAGLNTIKNTVFSLPRQTQIKAFLHSVSSNEIGSSQSNFKIIYPLQKQIPLSEIGGSLLRGVPAEKYSFDSDFYIFNDRVVLVSKAEEFGVTINSKEFADVMSETFNLAWDEACKQDTVARKQANTIEKKIKSKIR